MNTKKTYDKIADAEKICSKCNWYQYREKFAKFLLSLEKKKTIGSTIKKLVNNNTECANVTDIF